MNRYRFSLLSSACFAPDGGGSPPPPAPAPNPEPAADDPQSLADARALLKHTRNEAAGHRAARTVAEKAAEDARTEAAAKVAEAEGKVTAAQKAADQRIIMSELRLEAVKAGIVDPDGIKLLDLTKLKLDDAGNVVGAAELITEAKAARPWLFGGAKGTGNPTNPPNPNPNPKTATQMTPEEYKAARAAMAKA